MSVNNKVLLALGTGASDGLETQWYTLVPLNLQGTEVGLELKKVVR